MSETTEAERAAFAAEQAEKRLRDAIHELLVPVLPFKWIEPTVEAVLSERSPLVKPAVYMADLRREIDWQHHIGDQLRQAEAEIGRLRRTVDLAAANRAVAVLRLVGDLRPSRAARHGDGCHIRHAGCLAALVRDALTLDAALVKEAGGDG